SLVYDAELFERATAERLVGHYVKLLEEAMRSPGRSIEELELLEEAERRRVVEEWNRTAADYPRDATVIDLFEAQVGERPDGLALAFGDVQLTYGELDRRA